MAIIPIKIKWMGQPVATCNVDAVTWLRNVAWPIVSDCWWHWSPGNRSGLADDNWLLLVGDNNNDWLELISNFCR
jgi:hypothetical protein